VGFGVDGHSVNLTRTNKNTMNEQLEYYFIAASSHVLFTDLPKGFHEWEEEKLNEFLQDHAWEPFEGFSADLLYNHIEDIAMTIQRIANQG